MTDSPVCGVVSEGGSQKVPTLLFAPYRLPSERFTALFEKGRSEACASLVMRVLPNGTDRTRVGVITTKRTFRHAVDRTRARRLMREAFRLERPQMAVGYDIVLLGRRNLTTMSCQAVRRDLLKLCRRMGLIPGQTPPKRSASR